LKTVSHQDLKPPTILLFLKAPEMGKVKTRLAAAIGDEAALACYRMLVEGQLRRLPAKWAREVHFTPADAGKAMEEWLGNNFRYVPQVEGDLGERLEAGFVDAFARGAGVVCAIGGDCPELSVPHFEETRRRLEEGGPDVVFGPARDGGYTLIGMRALWGEAFRDIPWSAPDTLEVSVKRVNEAGGRVSLLAPLDDVDTVEDLERCGIKPADCRLFEP